jgi:hypothetical protein
LQPAWSFVFDGDSLNHCPRTIQKLERTQFVGFLVIARGLGIELPAETDAIESDNQASSARSELGVEFAGEQIASGLRT